MGHSSMRALRVSRAKSEPKSVPAGTDPSKSRYTFNSRTEDRSTLESEPSADPDRNGACAEQARSFQIVSNPFRPKR